jgi:putative DNA primase/helicase
VPDGLSLALTSLSEPMERPNDPFVTESMTDAAHAERFAEAYGLDLRFDHRRGTYLVYRAPLWRPDADGHVYRLAIDFARARQAQALQIPDRKLREQVVQHFIRAESKAALDRLVGLAKFQPPIADTGAWDVNPLLLGAPNGVIDLRTGKLRPGDPADRITMSVRVPYDPDATAPRWQRFVSEILSGDDELVSFIHRYVGYGLTGLTSEQLLALFYGRGTNGKTTFLNSLTFVFGDYAHNMPFSTIELKQRASIPNDLAALDRKRFVTASETNDGTRLNEARIKALTGCDSITARFLHSEWFTFQPVAKFVLAVNHKPTVTDDSLGFWRRIRLVPFLRMFSGTDRDPTLEEHFRTVEAPGILRWAVEGCLEWQAQGLGEPTAVKDATSEYQTDSDPLADFIAECCESAVTAVSKAGALHDAYHKWADRQRLGKAERLNGKEFGRRMAERFVRKHTKEGWFYHGVKLMTSRLW